MDAFGALKGINMKIIVGIDETGTETQMCDGWCYFGIMEDHYASFNSDVNAIKSKYSISGFHAKKFKISEREAYKEFLEIIDSYIIRSPISICSTYLYRKDWAQKLNGFGERVFSGSTREAGIENPEATKVAKKFMPPLMSLSMIGKGLDNRLGFEIYFDSDDVKEQIDSHVLSLDANISLTLRKTLSIVANTYRKMNFPSSPEILETEIQVLNDEKSNIIQAADLIGNFSNSYIFHRLGNASPKRIEKSEIFQSVFGKYLRKVDFSGTIQLHGRNDLELIGDAAALPFILGRC